MKNCTTAKTKVCLVLIRHYPYVSIVIVSDRYAGVSQVVLKGTQKLRSQASHPNYG